MEDNKYFKLTLNSNFRGTMNLMNGDKAPNFRLRNTEKQIVSLNDFPGENVLLLFFPLAFTSTCTTELCHVRDDMESYKDLNARILGISVDSLYALGRFKEDQKLNFQLISDFNKEVSRSYGVLYEDFGLDMQGVSKRAAFIIDKMGIIQYNEIQGSPGLLPDFEKIKQVLQNLKDVKKTP